MDHRIYHYPCVYMISGRSSSERRIKIHVHWQFRGIRLIAYRLATEDASEARIKQYEQL